MTDDAAAAIGRLCDGIDGLDPTEAAEIPYVLVGTVEEIAAKIVRCRERWGLTYFAVRELEPFAPVIEAVRTT